MDRKPDNKALGDVRQRAYSKLIEKHQLFNPFKYIVYSGLIDRETPPLER